MAFVEKFMGFAARFRPSPNAVMIAAQIGQKNMVPMSSAKFIPIGQQANISSGDLTLCAAAGAEVYNGDKRIGTIMVHQGNENPFKLRESTIAEISRHVPDLNFNNIQFDNPIIHSAPDTSLDNHGGPGQDTCTEMLKAIDYKIKSDEAMRVCKSNMVHPNILNLKIAAVGSFQHVDTFKDE